MSNKPLQNKKVLFIVAFRDFRDPEYFVPREIIEKCGAEIKVASDEMGTAIGDEGGEATVDFKLEEVNVADFDAIVFVGGPGALKHLDNEKSYKIAKGAFAQDKVLAAICISPVILAKAGVLSGKKATVWSSPSHKDSVNTLKENGAQYQEAPVVRDGNIVTASGPSAAKEFGRTIISALEDISEK